MDTITNSCTNTDIHKKRGTRTDSRTPSLDDGGLVHFSGPRLIGYDQLTPVSNSGHAYQGIPAEQTPSL